MTERAESAEVVFRPEAVAVTMTTSYPNWYPGERKSIEDTDKVRGDMAIQTVTSGVNRGLVMVVSDFRSSPAFHDQLSGLQIKLVERTGIDRASGRRQVIAEGSSTPGVEVIVRTEPEKDSLLDHIEAIVLPILRDEADIVIPKRAQPDFARTYPDYMYRSETEANKKFNNMLRMFDLLVGADELDLDIFFGPTILANRPDVLELFDERFEVKDGRVFLAGVRKYLAPDNFSNSQSFPVIEALSMGLRVASVEIPFEYPATQKENEVMKAEEFAKKRKGQKWGILNESLLFIRYLRDLNDPKNVLTRTGK